MTEEAKARIAENDAGPAFCLLRFVLFAGLESVSPVFPASEPGRRRDCDGS
jgi:hypothetical protein